MSPQSVLQKIYSLRSLFSWSRRFCRSRTSTEGTLSPKIRGQSVFRITIRKRQEISDYTEERGEYYIKH
jgi:hypothetical protein